MYIFFFVHRFFFVCSFTMGCPFISYVNICSCFHSHAYKRFSFYFRLALKCWTFPSLTYNCISTSICLLMRRGCMDIVLSILIKWNSELCEHLSQKSLIKYHESNTHCTWIKEEETKMKISSYIIKCVELEIGAWQTMHTAMANEKYSNEFIQLHFSDWKRTEQRDVKRM